jgi:hypothetical protein
MYIQYQITIADAGCFVFGWPSQAIGARWTAKHDRGSENRAAMLSHTKRNALTYALCLLNHDQRLLASYLGIPVGELVDYLDAKHEVPLPVLRKAICLALEKTQADKPTRREVLRKMREFNKKS